MNITQELMREHQLILKFNKALVEFSNKVTLSNDIVLFNTYAPVFSEFIELFADDYHHSKEEDVLFQELIKPNVLSHCNPISVMLHEHDEGRQYKQQLIDAIISEDLELFSKVARSYQQLMESHIFKEDNVLYGMAENALSDETKSEINKKYGFIENEKDKEKLWIQFEAVLKEIEQHIYA